ncbi:MAG: hypothetical protein IIW85_07555 [Bacteroidaceae bacterium]|nr:hypothetical protein [Bacteroidaceae bacterium]
MQTTQQPPQTPQQFNSDAKHFSTNGQPPQKKKNGCLKMLMISVCAFLAFLLLIGIIFGGDKTETVSKSQDSVKVEFSPSQEEKKITWSYQEEIDEMTDAVSKWAAIVSHNYINQDFPYQGETHAQITVRYMKKYGTDVIINITQGQIIGNEYEGTNYVTVRFDDAAPKKYYFNESADRSPETVFLRKPKDFIDRCKSAKEIKIEIPIYQSGNPLFKFWVDEPLEW